MLSRVAERMYWYGRYLERAENMARYMSEFTARNPGLIRMLRDRPEEAVPWAGVFPGQYLSSAQLMWRLTRNETLKAAVDAYVLDLIASQRDDGYLGPFQDLTGTLELWNHHALLEGLLLYHEDTRYEPALNACENIAALIVKAYGPGGGSIGKNGGANEAVCHTTTAAAYGSAARRGRLA